MTDRDRLESPNSQISSGGVRYLRNVSKGSRRAVESIRSRLLNSKAAADRLLKSVETALTLARHKKLDPKIASQIKKYAEICDAVYYTHLRRRAVADKYGMDIDSEFSTDRSFLLTKRHRTTKRVTEVILCLRGTKITSIEDLQTDLDIIRGRETESRLFKSALIMARAAIQKYGKTGLVVTGHSMSGTAAMYVSKELQVPAKVFNPGSSGLHVIDKIWKNIHFDDESKPTETKALNDRARKDKSLVSVYIVKGDFLSNFLLYNDKLTHKVYVLDNVKGTGAHSMDNFIYF